MLDVFRSSDGLEARRRFILIDHELLEGVQIGRDEGAHRLVVIAEHLLSSALRACRAGRSDQAGVRRAASLGG